LSQGDRGKEPTLAQSTPPPKEDLTEEAIYASTTPMETTKKLVKKLNMELTSLIMTESWTQEKDERMKFLVHQIHQYGVSNIFNYPIYLFRILIFILIQVLYKKLIIFTGVFVGNGS
jgi:hypothetical protein